MSEIPPFAALVRTDQREQELSDAELARRAGLRQSTVSDVLSGRRPDPQMSTVLALLHGLGRDLRWLHRGGLTPTPGPKSAPGKNPE